MSMLDVCGPVWCPICEPKLNARGRRIDQPLVESDANYSGTGTDMANCPKCGKGFCISYKIDTVQRAEEWDVPKEDLT